MLKGAFRSLAGEAGPAHALNRLDRLVAREGGDEDFVTALAGRLHPDGRILLASAGRSPLGAGPGSSGRWRRRSRPRHPGRARATCAPATGWSATPTGWSRPRNADGEFLDRSVFEEGAVAADSLAGALDRLVSLMIDEHAAGRHDDDLALLGLDDPRSGGGG